MNWTFDFYEYAGFIIPGAVLVIALVWLFPDSRALFSKEGVTLGELGLFVIIAYAAGQLVQAIGNYLEWIWWMPWGGMPSGQVLCGKYLSTDQHKRLLEALRPDRRVRIHAPRRQNAAVPSQQRLGGLAVVAIFGSSDYD